MDTTTKLTMEEFGAKVKEKYPQYASLDNRELAVRTLDKYPEYQQRIKPEQSGFFAGVKEDLAKRGENVNEAFNKDQSFVSKTLQLIGQGAGFVGDVVGEGIKSVGRGVSAITPDAIEKPIVQGTKAVGKAILDTPLGQAGLRAIEGGMESYNKFKQENPETAGNLEAVVNIATLFPVGKGAQMAGKGVIRGGEVVGGVVKQGAEAVGNVVKPALQTAKNAAIGTGTVLGSAGRGIASIPGRIATNVAEKQAVRQTIKELPSTIAQKAVSNGIDINDAKVLYNLPKSAKPEIKKLVDVVTKFDAGLTKTNPIEVVGAPIVKRIKSVQSEAVNIGKKLGDVSKTLGTVSSKELAPTVFNKLNGVLDGLEVNNKGILNFKNTVLATAETASDRKAIQSIFTQAIKSGSGQSKHKLRQELFEVLGGKKKSLTNITGKQEEAYQAVRQALSDVLDTKNPTYKDLNLKYAKTIEPISQLNKLLKSSGKDEDILNMSAGLLARRLASNAASNPQIRQILRTLDAVGKGKGKTILDTEKLLEVYNLLEKYYPSIVGKTSLKGQVSGAIEGASSVQGLVLDTIKNLAGKSDAVKRKALKDIFDEVLI